MKDAETVTIQSDSANSHDSDEVHKEMVHNVPKVRRVSFLPDLAKNVEIDRLLRDFKLYKGRVYDYWDLEVSDANIAIMALSTEICD